MILLVNCYVAHISLPFNGFRISYSKCPQSERNGVCFACNVFCVYQLADTRKIKIKASVNGAIGKGEETKRATQIRQKGTTRTDSSHLIF